MEAAYRAGWSACMQWQRREPPPGLGGCAEVGQTFDVPTAECLVAPASPYRFRVLRRHRDAGYWECVCESGGHPAQHRSIHIYAGSDIERYRGDAARSLWAEGYDDAADAPLGSGPGAADLMRACPVFRTITGAK